MDINIICLCKNWQKRPFLGSIFLGYTIFYKNHFFKKDQYVRYLGSNIKIRYKGEEERYVTTNGILNKVTEEGLFIESIKEDLFICFNNIEKANLLFTEVRDAK